MPVNRPPKAMLKDVMDGTMGGLGEEALLWLGDASEPAFDQPRALLNGRAAGELWKGASTSEPRPSHDHML